MLQTGLHQFIEMWTDATLYYIYIYIYVCIYIYILDATMRAKARIFSELGAKARILFRTALTKKTEKQIKTYNKSQTLDFILN